MYIISIVYIYISTIVQNIHCWLYIISIISIYLQGYPRVTIVFNTKSWTSDLVDILGLHFQKNMPIHYHHQLYFTTCLVKCRWISHFLTSYLNHISLRPIKKTGPYGGLQPSWPIHKPNFSNCFSHRVGMLGGCPKIEAWFQVPMDDAAGVQVDLVKKIRGILPGECYQCTMIHIPIMCLLRLKILSISNLLAVENGKPLEHH